jgi:DNA repair protein RecO (recombination protein O)
MEKYLRTKAIVLKRSNYKEADRLITLYTEQKGKITVIAKGIRKITSTKRGHMELFNLIDMQAVDHKGWYILTQVESIKTYSAMKDSSTITPYGYYICEIFEKLVPEAEPSEILFRLLSKTLDYVDKSPSLTILNAFNLKLLKILGFYSRSQIKNSSHLLVGYLNQIEMDTYETIRSKGYPQAIEKQAHMFLRNFTESVLEREIKTKLEI